MTGAHQSFQAMYQAIAPSRTQEPGWLASARAEAMDHFVTLGLPTPKLEAWKHTNLRSFAKRNFALASGDASGWSEEELFAFGDLGGVRLVFVDGAFAPALSRLTGPDPEVAVRPLADAISEGEGMVSELFGRGFAGEDNAFAHLNTALFTDGVLVDVPRGVAVSAPIEVVYAATRGAHDKARFTRNLILAGRGSELTLVERHIGAESEDFGSSATEIVLRDGAVMTHLQVHQEARSAAHVVQRRIELGRDAHYRALQANLGGRLVRCETKAALLGENGELEIDGFYIPRDNEHVDNWTLVDHAVPNCRSRQLFKVIASERGRGVFNGKVLVREDAQKTNAIQHNANLVLSDQAIVDTRPQLEIYADDVRCTHGATVGQMDSEALFYLQARGIPEGSARQMLTTGFAKEVLDNVGLAAVRDYVAASLAEKLQGA